MSMPMSTARAGLTVEASHSRGASIKSGGHRPASSISSKLSTFDQRDICLTGIMMYHSDPRPRRRLSPPVPNKANQQVQA